MEAKIRLIPAGAGNIARRGPSASKAGAHPRRCGENKPAFRLGYQLPGSSPQVRGKQHLKTIATIAGRLIPAGAGKTGACCGACVGDSAHPRRCGENPSTLSLQVSRFGSSPQVRGKLYGVRALLSSSGLIPAGAGKTVARMRGIRGRAAHPRRCGENYYPVC